MTDPVPGPLDYATPPKEKEKGCGFALAVLALMAAGLTVGLCVFITTFAAACRIRRPITRPSGFLMAGIAGAIIGRKIP